MRAILTVAWAEARRRRLQSTVIVVMVALASGTITLGSTSCWSPAAPSTAPSRPRRAPTSGSSTTLAG
jgi:hypothetical protein